MKKTKKSISMKELITGMVEKVEAGATISVSTPSMTTVVSKRLETIPCKRCGKDLASLKEPIGRSRSLWNYKGICESCLTDEERNEIAGMLRGRYI